MGGASSGDIAQICFGYGMFTGAGPALRTGEGRSGYCSFLHGQYEKADYVYERLCVYPLVATPSYALRIAEVAEEIGVDVKKELKIKIGLVGSELMTEAMRQEMYKAGETT